MNANNTTGMRRWARTLPHKMVDQNGQTVIDEPSEVWILGILKKQLLELKIEILETKNFQGDWAFRMTKEDGDRVAESFPEPDHYDGMAPVWLSDEEVF